jgi:hypothetical protein
MIPKEKYSQTATVVIFGITTIIWVYSLATKTLLLRSEEIAFLALLFAVPAGLVCAAIWILLDARWWRRLLGTVLLLPSVAIWGLSLLLTIAGFKIH